MKYAWKRKGRRHSKNYGKLEPDRSKVYSDCSRKKSYTTTADANRAIKKCRKYSKIKLYYYQCSFCGKYHLTKKLTREKFK